MHPVSVTRLLEVGGEAERPGERLRLRRMASGEREQLWVALDRGDEAMPKIWLGWGVCVYGGVPRSLWGWGPPLLRRHVKSTKKCPNFERL